MVGLLLAAAACAGDPDTSETDDLLVLDQAQLLATQETLLDAVDEIEVAAEDDEGFASVVVDPDHNAVTV